MVRLGQMSDDVSDALVLIDRGEIDKAVAILVQLRETLDNLAERLEDR